jgi:Cytochrome c oxidase subunit IV
LELRKTVSEEQNQSQQGQQAPGKESQGVQEQVLHPHTSYWPFALALASFVMLMGLITNPVVLAIGAILTAAAVIGWGLERR